MSRLPPTRSSSSTRDLNIVDPARERRIYGYPKRSTRTHGLNIIDEEDRPVVEAALRRTFEIGEVVTVRFRAATPTDTRSRSRPVARFAKLRWSADASRLHHRDVTAAAQTQAALAENLAKMRAIIDTAVDAITIIDREGIDPRSQSGERAMYGIPEENRRGHSVLEFVHYNDQASS